MLLMSKPKKRPVGRPKKEDAEETASVSGRVPVGISQALRELATIRRRSISAEIGIKAEDIVLSGEEELRRAGKWTPALDKLKSQRNVDKQ